jgi:hypothetical protein
LQLETEGDPECDGVDQDVDIIGDDVQMKTEAAERHAEAEMSVMKVPMADIPDEVKIPHRPEV